MAGDGDFRRYTRAELEEVAGRCAGAAAGVFLRKHPQDVMPTEEISEAMGLAIAAWDEERGSAAGFSADQIAGYAGARGETRHVSTVREGEEFPDVQTVDPRSLSQITQDEVDSIDAAEDTGAPCPICGAAAGEPCRQEVHGG